MREEEKQNINVNLKVTLFINYISVYLRKHKQIIY